MIVVGGENLIDLVATPASDGAPAYIPHPGGSPFNVAMAAGRQGADVAYLTPVSSDVFGGILVSRLEDAGVELLGGRNDRPTSLAVVSINDGIPAYAFYRTDTAERQVTRESIGASMPKSARVLHVGSAALIDGDDADAWEDALAQARGNGILTSLDPNIRPSLVVDTDAHRGRIRRMMHSADIVKASDEDLEWLYPDMGIGDIRKICVDDAPEAAVVVTAGEADIWASTGGRAFSVPTHPVQELADTVGAGDTFMASLLVWCSGSGDTREAMVEALHSPDFEEALRRGSAAAALNCGHHGCVPPGVDEIDAALAMQEESHG